MGDSPAKPDGQNLDGNSPVHGVHHGHGTPMEDVQHHEFHKVTAVPTKTGNEPAHGDAPSARPMSAGTASSGAVDFDDGENDEAILAENAVTRNEELTDSRFARPQGAVGTKSQTGYTFVKPTSPETEQKKAIGMQHSQHHAIILEQQSATAVDGKKFGSFQMGGMNRTNISVQRTLTHPPRAVPVDDQIDRPLLDRTRRKRWTEATFANSVPVDVRTKRQTASGSRGNYTSSHTAARLRPKLGIATPAVLEGPPLVSSAHCQGTPKGVPPQAQDTGKTADNLELAVLDLPIETKNHALNDAMAAPIRAPSQPKSISLSEATNSEKRRNASKSTVQNGVALARAGGTNGTKSPRQNTTPPQSPSSPEQTLRRDAMSVAHHLTSRIRNQAEQNAAEIDALMLEKGQQIEEAVLAQERTGKQLDLILHKHSRLEDKIRADEDTIRKAYRLTSFVNGLGGDVNRMIADAQRHQSSIEELTEICAKGEQQREELRETVEKALEETGTLKKRAFDLCQELQNEQVKAAAEIQRLTTELSDKTDILDSELRHRSDLERQLSEARQAQADLRSIIEADSAAILDKLVAIERDINVHQKSKILSDQLKDLTSAVECLQTDSTSTLEGISSIKDLVKSLSEKLAQMFSEIMFITEDGHSATLTAFKTHFDNVLTQVKKGILNSEEMLQQDACHREAIATLREQLSACNIREQGLEMQLNTVQEDGQRLQQQNNALQSKLASLHDSASQAQEDQLQLEQARIELNASNEDLKEAQENLASKCEELRIFNETHAQLKMELEALLVQIDGYQERVIAFEREREELTSKAVQIEQGVRKEMQEHLDQVEVNLRAESRNELKKVSSERNRLQERVLTLQENLRAVEGQVLERQQDESLQTSTKQELEKSEKKAKVQLQELETLKASLDNVRDAERLAKQEATGLAKRLEAEQLRCQTTVTESSKLEEQIDSLNRAMRDAKLLEAKHKKEWQEKESVIKRLEKQYTEAQEKAERGEQGLKLYKASSEKVLKDANDERKRHIDALQQALVEREGELEQVKGDKEQFRTNIEQRMRFQEEAYEKDLSESQRRLEEAERRRDDAEGALLQVQSDANSTLEAERKEFTQQINDMRQRADAAEANSKDIQATLNACYGDNAFKIPVSTGSQQQTKPHGKSNRDIDPQSGVEPVAALDLQHSDLRKTNSAGSGQQWNLADEPSQVVEELINEEPHEMPLSGRSSHSPGIADILRIQESKLLQLPPVVEETQLQYFTAKLDHTGPEFSMYEDTLDYDGSLNTQTPQEHGELQRTINWSQTERDKCTFRKPAANPNSASKRVHPYDNANNNSRRSVSYGSHSDASGIYLPETPRVLKESQPRTVTRNKSNLSSSPGFMHESQSSSRNMSTYQSQGHSGYRGASSRIDSSVIADPRLASCNMPAPAQKRRSSGQTMDGPQRARKKRSVAGVLSGGKHSQSQNVTSSQTLLPSPSTTTLDVSLHEGSARRLSSRVRTLSGASTRITRSSKALKNDEVNARFSQELYRR